MISLAGFFALTGSSLHTYGGETAQTRGTEEFSIFMNTQLDNQTSPLYEAPSAKVIDQAHTLLARYAQGERAFGALDLRGANLWGANLSHAQLTAARLNHADLRRANLCGAELRDADLSGALLVGADLTGADLRGANLRAANLYCAELTGALLDEADLSETTLYDPALSRARREPVAC